MILNDLSNFTVFPYGLSNERHSGLIYYHPFNKGAGGVVSGNSGPDFLLKSEKAIFDKLDSVSIPSNNISVIKIDVEGHELDVINGGKESISHHKPNLLIEIHPSRLEKKGQTVEQLLSCIFDIGYDKIYLIEDDVELGKKEAMDSLSRVENNHGI
ncbi:FkbM family methyltransferase [Halobacteriales archaeon Cl-PHB]